MLTVYSQNHFGTPPGVEDISTTLLERNLPD